LPIKKTGFGGKAVSQKGAKNYSFKKDNWNNIVKFVKLSEYFGI